MDILYLTLEHQPASDIPATLNAPAGYSVFIRGRRSRLTEVQDLDHARRHFIYWRDRNGLSENNLTKRAGEVRRRNGGLVGRFHYDGSFWAPNNKEIKLA